MSRLDPKDPAEKKLLVFSFANQVEAGVAIASATVAVLVQTGTDATPAAMLDGVPLINGSDVLQRLQGGISGVDYHLRCLATDGSGLVHLVSAVLPVKAL
jgi:hypothetical protein